MKPAKAASNAIKLSKTKTEGWLSSKKIKQAFNFLQNTIHSRALYSLTCFSTSKSPDVNEKPWELRHVSGHVFLPGFDTRQTWQH